MKMATMVISDATNRKMATQGCLSKIFVLRSIIKLDKKLRKHCAQLSVNVNILTIFCMVSSDLTTRGSRDLLKNRTHQLTRNMIYFNSFYFIMQGKLIILGTRCFLHQNTSQLQWFKEKNNTPK